MKDGMRQYAFKSRKIQESYLRKHSDGGAGRKAREAGRCHRIQQSRESKKEEVNAAVELYGKFVQLTEQVIPNVPLSEEEQLALDIYTKALKESSTKLRQLDEERREKESIEAYQGRHGIIKDIPKSSGSEMGSIDRVLESHLSSIENMRYTVCDRKETAIQNMVDEVVALYLSTLYKLRNLK